MRIIILAIILSLVLCDCNKKQTDVPEVFNFSNLDGKMAFSRSSGKIIILDGDKKTDTCVTSINEEPIWDASVSLSPDGDYITYSAGVEDGYQVFKMSVKGRDNLKLTKSTSGFVEHYTSPLWSADGERIYYVENGLYILGPVYSIRPDGADITQITDFAVYRRVSISKDNSFVVFSNAASVAPSANGIYLYNTQESSISQIITYNDIYTAYSPVLSPDEKKIAFVLRHGPNEQGIAPFFFRIMIVKIDGTGENLVIELPFEIYRSDVFVTWSPDGAKLAYNFGSGMNDDDGSHIFIINTDGTGLTQVTSNTDYDGAPCWIK